MVKWFYKEDGKTTSLTKKDATVRDIIEILERLPSDLMVTGIMSSIQNENGMMTGLLLGGLFEDQTKITSYNKTSGYQVTVLE